MTSISQVSCTILLVACLLLVEVSSLKVESVSFGKGRPWAVPPDESVVCSISLGADEEVSEVTWIKDKNELVYRWLEGEGATASGALLGKVDPGTLDSWNISLSVVDLDLEGNFTCIATSNLGNNDSSTFEFITYKRPTKFTFRSRSTVDCTWDNEWNMTDLYPVPKIECTMNPPPSGGNPVIDGNLTITENADNGTYNVQYKVKTPYGPKGAMLEHSGTLFGKKVESIRVSVTQVGCPEMVPARTNFTLDAQRVTRNCWQEPAEHSVATYICKHDPTATLKITCDAPGLWSVDLTRDDNWPDCESGATLITPLSWVLAVLCTFFLLQNRLS